MRKNPAHFLLAIPVFADDLGGGLASDLAKIQNPKSNATFCQTNNAKSSAINSSAKSNATFCIKSSKDFALDFSPKVSKAEFIDICQPQGYG